MFKLSSKSLARLDGVHPDLVKVVKTAITLTKADFTVHCGLRTAAEQARLVASGASQTLDGKHLRQQDGYGHAVDLVPYVNGKLEWSWPECFQIAAAVRDAAAQHNVRIKWGGAWVELMARTDPVAAVEAYKAARKKAGKKAFLDGVHFELIKSS